MQYCTWEIAKMYLFWSFLIYFCINFFSVLENLPLDDDLWEARNCTNKNSWWWFEKLNHFYTKTTRAMGKNFVIFARNFFLEKVITNIQKEIFIYLKTVMSFNVKKKLWKESKLSNKKYFLSCLYYSIQLEQSQNIEISFTKQISSVICFEKVISLKSGLI